jgi:hypothetical protein
MKTVLKRRVERRAFCSAKPNRAKIVKRILMQKYDEKSCSRCDRN